MNEILKIISVIAISSVKFVGGPTLAYAYQFNYFQIVIFTVLGGVLGVFMMVHFSDPLVSAWNWIVKLFKKLFSKNKFQYSTTYKNNTESSHRKEKIFTKRNRRIVKLWKMYGLLGIAIVTPVLLSIPVGTFIATRLVHNKRRIMLYMSISVIFWSFLLTSVYELL